MFIAKGIGEPKDYIKGDTGEGMRAVSEMERTRFARHRRFL